jgi:hypothetical protein
MTAGGSLAVVPEVKAGQAQAVTLYIHGMVWNTKLPAPMNDWLIRLDAKVDAAIGNGPMPPHPGFATLGDDLHDPVGSHATINSAVLRDDQLVVLGAITESKTPSLVGQSFRLEGKVVGEEVQGLTVTIGGATFTGAGLLVKIAIIAILIAL